MYLIPDPKALRLFRRINNTARQQRFLEKQLPLPSFESEETGGRNARGTSAARPPVSSFFTPPSEGAFFLAGVVAPRISPQVWKMTEQEARSILIARYGLRTGNTLFCFWLHLVFFCEDRVRDLFTRATFYRNRKLLSSASVPWKAPPPDLNEGVD